jgi:tetratricopeptide (TPR) repeat protein
MLNQKGQTVQESTNTINIDSLWEYTNPAESEDRFRAALTSAHGDARLELLTQIARTYGLRQRFDEAHELLNQVEEQLAHAGPRPRVRYLLERGRTFNSGGDTEKARMLFVEAWELAQTTNQEGLAVDAAHMVAITYAGTQEAIEWNKRGLVVARRSQDPKALALIPAMLNNSAWDLHEMGRFHDALALFEEARTEWIARGAAEQVQVANWAAARCLRSLGRYDQALTIQRALEAEHMAMGSADGYVFEEIAENLAALGKSDEAKPYFGKAVAELRKDDWFVKNEAARLANLISRADAE